MDLYQVCSNYAGGGGGWGGGGGGGGLHVLHREDMKISYCLKSRALIIGI